MPARIARAALAVALALVAILATGARATASEAPHAASVRSFFVQVTAAPGSAARIPIDATLYTPAVTPAPAVLLAHGLGQTKAALVPEAERLQGEGFVVLAYTARGFGRSGGRSALDSLDFEVPDARALVDVLAADPDVERRGADPLVAAVGGSYGGALALMLGATDPRIATVVAAITWNDLASALDPPVGGGVRDFKSGWASRLFTAGLAGATTPCGRFADAFCALYRRLVDGSQPTAADLALMARSSPATVLSGLHAPTLLLQGVQDGLFGLDQADRTARTLARHGTGVQVRWFDGGHDGGGTDGTDGVVDAWLAQHLRGRAVVPPQFAFTVPATTTSFDDTRTADAYPGLSGDEHVSIPLAGPAQSIVNPPGGRPQATTGVPGVAASSRAGAALAQVFAASDPPAGQAVFVSAPLAAPALLAGTASVPIRVEATTGARTALLYAQLAVRTGTALVPLPGGVAPVAVPLPAGAATVRVRLPATVQRFATGDRLVLTIRTTDSEWIGSADGAGFRVSPAGAVELPGVRTGAPVRSAGLPSPWVLGGIGAALAVAIVLLLLGAIRSRRGSAGAGAPPGPTAPGGDAVPLAVRGLTKRFRSGFLAVDDVSFTVLRGQVVGLLGENGAGKTTTLRMVTGLMRPDAGDALVFGAPATPGSPVLSRLGCFIEGPGFLPHLSGRRNLELYWAATGRPRSAAGFDEALRVADLGGAIRNPVRSYSQGMRQRLALAQAMLGSPDLLVLDEPTNGLDPPQIAALRGVLQRYAAGGRTVIVSSHLLGEVQRTCSHVVVMTHGRVVAAGPVAEVAQGGDLEAAFLDLIGATEPSA